MTTLKEIIDQLEAELQDVIAEDMADAEFLSDEEVQYNEGWAGGMSRAILLLKMMEQTIQNMELLKDIESLGK